MKLHQLLFSEGSAHRRCSDIKNRQEEFNLKKALGQ